MSSEVKPDAIVPAGAPAALQAGDVPDGARSKPERILDAALVLFATQGYHATAVPEIARRAGVATGTIYRHFETKDVLLNVLYQRWRGEFNAQVLAPLPDGLSVREMFGVHWRRLAAWIRDYPLQTVFLEQHYHKPLLDEASTRAERAYLDAFRALVRTGIASGEIRDLSPALAVALVRGTANDMAKLCGDGDLVLDDAIVAQAEASLWDAVKA